MEVHDRTEFFSMGWFGEEENGMDYLGLITSLPCTLISIIASYLSIAYDTVLELSMSAYELLLGLTISGYEILLGLAISAYELLLGLAVGVSDLLSLQEWWATENTIMAVWLIIVLPALCKRSWSFRCPCRAARCKAVALVKRCQKWSKITEHSLMKISLVIWDLLSDVQIPV